MELGMQHGLVSKNSSIKACLCIPATDCAVGMGRFFFTFLYLKWGVRGSGQHVMQHLRQKETDGGEDASTVQRRRDVHSTLYRPSKHVQTVAHKAAPTVANSKDIPCVARFLWSACFQGTKHGCTGRCNGCVDVVCVHIVLDGQRSWKAVLMQKQLQWNHDDRVRPQTVQQEHNARTTMLSSRCC